MLNRLARTPWSSSTAPFPDPCANQPCTSAPEELLINTSCAGKSAGGAPMTARAGFVNAAPTIQTPADAASAKANTAIAVAFSIHRFDMSTPSPHQAIRRSVQEVQHDSKHHCGEHACDHVIRHHAQPAMQAAVELADR